MEVRITLKRNKKLSKLKDRLGANHKTYLTFTIKYVTEYVFIYSTTNTGLID
jgi:hypothetical protein